MSSLFLMFLNITSKYHSPNNGRFCKESQNLIGQKEVEFGENIPKLTLVK